MTTVDRKITVPNIDGVAFTYSTAAALCALSRFGRIFKDPQFRAAVWWYQRYVAAWITAKRFFVNSRHYTSAAFAIAREQLAREGLITVEIDGAHFCSPQGNALAAKLRAAMPEALGENEFADARKQASYERQLKRGGSWIL